MCFNKSFIFTEGSSSSNGSSREDSVEPGLHTPQKLSGDSKVGVSHSEETGQLTGEVNMWTYPTQYYRIQGAFTDSVLLPFNVYSFYNDFQDTKMNKTSV